MVAADWTMEIWQRVLQYVPLQQRLGSCALVCSKFHAAAVAATDSIDTSSSELVNQDSFLAYLQHHGSQLTSLKLNGSMVLEELPPCQHLQQLCLTDCEVQLGPDEGCLGVLGSVTGITRLEIERCVIYGRDAFAGLSVLVNLQHLCVVEQEEGNMCQLPGMAWSSMQQLTYLKLNWVKMTTEDLCHISSMSRLCALDFISGEAHLTSDAAPGGFALPSSLRRLVFADLLEPSVLAAATQLTYLNLSDAVIEGQGDALSGSCLLGALSELHHLDTLCLSWVGVDWPPASLAYQAILASSSLRSLTINLRNLPAGVFNYLFSPDPPQQLVRTCLEELTVMCEAPLDTRVLCGLVGVCPSLQQLNVCLAGGPDLNELSKLAALTRLVLRSSDTVCAQYVAILTRLHELSLWFDLPDKPGLPSLLELTALRQLTRLSSSTNSRVYASITTKVRHNR